MKPLIVFAFYGGVTSVIAQELRELGIIVVGNEVPVGEEIEKKLSELSFLSSETDSDDQSSEDESGVDSSRQNKESNGYRATLKDDKSESIRSEFSSSYCDQKRSLKCPADISSATIVEKVSPFDVNACHSNLIDEKETSNIECKELDENRTTVSRTLSIKMSVSLSGDAKSFCDINPSTSSAAENSQRTIETNLGNKTLDLSPCPWTFRDDSMLKFISNELLINALVDYTPPLATLEIIGINTIDNISLVNLDVTALITLVSSVCHGGCYFRFQEKILSEQAAEERSNPVLPKLQAFLKGYLIFKHYNYRLN